MKNLSIAIAILLAAPLARAQDDNATGSSGHDPSAQPPLHTVEIEGTGAGASAAHREHAFGVGFGETPSGIFGFEAEYQLGTVVLDGTFGFDIFSPKNGDSASVVGVGGAVLYRFKIWDDAALMAGGRLELLHITNGSSISGVTYSTDGTQVNIEIPLRGEVYFGKVLAVHGEVAAVLALVTDGIGRLGSDAAPKGTYFAVPLTNLIGDFGVTFFLP
jgi:hypothetical protein